MKNPILKELYDIRDEILVEHKDDLADYLRAGLAQTKASGHLACGNMNSNFATCHARKSCPTRRERYSV